MLVSFVVTEFGKDRGTWVTSETFDFNYEKHHYKSINISLCLEIIDDKMYFFYY